MSALYIDNRAIGPDHPVCVIAEIGVNHDGQVERALQLVDAAKSAGADAIKLQVFRASQLMHASSRFASYQQQRCIESDPTAMLRRYELTGDELQSVFDYARARDLIPLATPFSLSDVPVLTAMNLPAIKIASPDLANWPLLRAAAATGKPLLLSTGAATLDEVEQAAQWLRNWQTSFVLLHCVSSYPTPPEQAHLSWISELTQAAGVPVGFSDHTQEILAGALAVAAGACVIEKHLTCDRLAQGPDHAASADPQQFRDYVHHIRLAQRLRGHLGKTVLPVEHDVRTVSRQSLVLARPVRAGHRLLEADLTVQRPATGIPAANWPQVIGRQVNGDLPAGTMLQWTMLQAATTERAA